MSNDSPSSTGPGRIGIHEAAELLDRREGTIRKWEQQGVLPDELLPKRDHRGWRYWTPEQIDGIKKWLRVTDRRPGKGLKHYDPDEAEVSKVLRSLRGPRSTDPSAA